jgi:PAS domain-containing protein
MNEIGLARALAQSLVLPMFIVDEEGNLLFYNEPAEVILGERFSDTGEMKASVWSRLFIPTEEDGSPLAPELLPLMITLSEHKPAHKRFAIKNLENVSRVIEVTSFPLLGAADRFLGAVAIFWEVPEDQR